MKYVILMIGFVWLLCAIHYDRPNQEISHTRQILNDVVTDLINEGTFIVVKEMPNDGWGKRIEAGKTLDQHSLVSAYARSSGADGEFNTEDDMFEVRIFVDLERLMQPKADPNALMARNK